MPHSEAWAKRLLGKLPADPEDLLQGSYVDPTFLGLFFDWLDERIYQDPQAGLRWAEVAPRLALLVPEDGGPEGRQAHREAMVIAYAILGGAYRAAGRPDDAEEPYQVALRIADSGTISPNVRADLDQRLSYLRMCQERLDDAEALLSEDVGSAQLRAEILVKRGMIHRRRGAFQKAIECYGEALRITNPKASKPAYRLHHCAAHNLAHAVANVTSLSIDRPEVRAALRYVRAAGQLIKGQRNSVPRHKLQWVEGLCWRKLGHHARAERAFRRASAWSSSDFRSPRRTRRRRSDCPRYSRMNRVLNARPSSRIAR